MKHKSTFGRVTALLCLTITAGVGYAAPLTEQQLIDMKAAGIGEKVIIHQVETDGIAFPVDASTMIALRKAGFSDSLLNALLNTKEPAKPSSAPPSGPTVSTPQVVRAGPCVTWQREADRLHSELEAIDEACTNLGHQRHPPSVVTFAASLYADHCKVANECAVLKKLVALGARPEPTVRGNLEEDQCSVEPVYMSPDPDSICRPDDPRPYDEGPMQYRNVQVLQPNDNQLSCAELKVYAFALVEDLTQMDKSVQHLNGQAQTNSQMAQAAGAIAPSATAASAGLQMMSSSNTQKATDLLQIRESYQKRHDYLMQVYFQKRCQD